MYFCTVKALFEKSKTEKSDEICKLANRNPTERNINVNHSTSAHNLVSSSFMVETDGKKVFHAGDLNNWHWEDESTPQEVKKMEGDFMAVLRDIKAEYPAVDLAMFPVDPRLGTDFARGARQWIQTIKTTYMAPMHFPPAREKAMTFGKEAEFRGTKFLYIHREGEEIGTL